MNDNEILRIISDKLLNRDMEDTSDGPIFSDKANPQDIVSLWNPLNNIEDYNEVEGLFAKTGKWSEMCNHPAVRSANAIGVGKISDQSTEQEIRAYCRPRCLAIADILK